MRRITLRLLREPFSIIAKEIIWKHSLRAISMVSLYQHDLLCNIFALLGCAETDQTSQARVSLLVSVCNTHATSNRNIEPFQFAIVADNSNKTEIVGEHINIVCRRYSNSNFELCAIQPSDDTKGKSRGWLPFSEGRTRHTRVQSP